MSDISIKEGGTSRNFSDVDTIILQNTNTKDATWVSESSVPLTDITLDAEGEYNIGDFEDDKYGWGSVYANVYNFDESVYGEYDGGEYNFDGDFEFDEYGNIISAGNFTMESKPSYLEITTPPTKLEYHDGEAIDLTGIVVTAKNADGTTWTSEDYPDGIIPIEELIADPTTANIKETLNTKAVSSWQGSVLRNQFTASFTATGKSARVKKYLYASYDSGFEFSGIESYKNIPLIFVYDNGVVMFRKGEANDIDGSFLSGSHLLLNDARWYMWEKYAYKSSNPSSFNHAVESKYELGYSGYWARYGLYILHNQIILTHGFSFKYNGSTYYVIYRNVPYFVYNGISGFTLPRYSSIKGVTSIVLRENFQFVGLLSAESKGNIQHDDLDGEIQEIIEAYVDNREINKCSIELRWTKYSNIEELRVGYVINVTE